MIFCPTCGRPRAGSNRFCNVCGNAFAEQSADSGTPLAGQPAVQPRWDAPGGATRVETPDAAQAPAGPDPFAPWVAPPPAHVAGPPSDSPGGRWGTADTLSARPSAGPAYQGPRSPGPGSPGPGYQGPGYSPPPSTRAPERRPAGGRRAAFIIVVVLVALATGGGAYALVSASSDKATAQPSGGATITAQASTAAPTAAPTNPPTASAIASPSIAPPPSATARPTQTGTVRVAAGAASDPAAPQVEAFLNRYFNAINTRNYGEYNSLLDAQRQQGDAQSTFESGYATTKDTNEVLTGITDTGGGSLTANVSFTSHQSPSDSIDQSACNDWQISLYLVPQGGSYVQTATPAGYAAAYSDC
jgi:hypothetical protein